MSSEEKEFNIAKYEERPRDIFDFAGLEIEALQANQALLKQKWEQFVKYRKSIKKSVNRFVARNMQEIDELIAEAFRLNIISEDKKLFKFLLQRYSESGAKAKMVQIDAIMQGFRDYFNATANENKLAKEQPNGKARV